MNNVTTFEDKPPKLEEVQRLVEGFVEMHRLPDGRQLLMNEDGLRLGLELNLEASKEIGFPVVGHVVVLDGKAKWK